MAKSTSIIEGDITIDLTPGTEQGKAGIGMTSFVQESITDDVKGHGKLGGGVFDHQRTTADQEVGRIENDELIFPVGILDSTGQCHAPWTTTETCPYLEPISLIDSIRLELSPSRRSLMRSLSCAAGAMRIVAYMSWWRSQENAIGYRYTVRSNHR